MKPELLEKLKNALKGEKLDKIIQSEDFYFQKAVDKYNEFMALPKIGKEITLKLLNEITQLRDSSSFSHMVLIDEYKDNLEIHDLLFVIGELISYLDLHAANKKEFNKYEDKRTLASAGVRQHVWLTNLLSYKETENVEELTGVIKNAIRYLISPDKVLNILSERHRKLMGIFIFENLSTSLNFDELVIKELEVLNIAVKSEKNRPFVYEQILYSEAIKKIWNYNQTIWKISHGNIDSFAEGERENYLKEKIITVHKDTGKSQGKNFVDTMKIGDLFYLCYGGRKIKLLGIITSKASLLTGNDSKVGWMKRSYDVIKQSISTDAYKGINMGWTPNHNSTCVAVRGVHLTIFEKELLLPYFEMSLEELLSGDIPLTGIEGKIENDNNTETDDDTDETIIESKVFDDLNYIIYGPPGTGKTYNTVDYAVAMIENKEVGTLQVEEHKSVKERYDKLKKENQIAFITFHQSFGYEEFIEGIKPRLNKDNSGEISYYLAEGIFKEFCTQAKEHRNKNYVFIIDEINRGNISKIFGELITLIERSKRIGREEETMAFLPYSKEEFGVPENVFILGTMNTADRSIALLDTALRRRFEFIEMMPNTDVFKKNNDNKELIVEKIDIKNMLDMINNRIEILYDREHTIGQSYFIDLISNNGIDNLSNIFVHKIIPLLQEYFYDDYEKIRMILADDQTKNIDLQFIKVSDIPKNIFGKNLDSEILEDKKVYTINVDALTNPNAYIKIYNINTGAL